jgi:hypothetical protein
MILKDEAHGHRAGAYVLVLEKNLNFSQVFLNQSFVDSLQLNEPWLK